MALPAPVKSKTCFKCNEHKPLKDFYVHPQMGDGHLNKCKECTKRDTAERSEKLSKVPEWVLLERMRHRLKSAMARLEGAATRLTPAQKAEVTEKYRSKYPEKRAAHYAVAKAIRAEILKKQPCEKCGAVKVQAHHDDYSKPLEVRWLCVPHHNEHHVAERDREIIAKLTGGPK